MYNLAPPNDKGNDMLKTQDQILYVPSNVYRRDRPAHQVSEEEPITELGFITSIRQQVAFCRFYHSDGNLRTVANSEVCNPVDLVPCARTDRDDQAVLAQVLRSERDRIKKEMEHDSKRQIG